MRYMKKIAVLLVPLVLLLAGCGGDSSGTAASNPFSNTGGTGTSTPTGSGTVLSYNLSLSMTSPSGPGSTVGPNSEVIATAILTDSSGKPVANQPIKFEKITGPVTINPAIVNTDSSGKAINFLLAGSTTTSAIDVIIEASTSVNGQLVTAVSIFTILRSESNTIKFLTTKGPTDPDGTLNTLRVTLTNATSPAAETILQLVPFQILDNNGIPRSHVPVQISIYSEIGNCPVFIDSPETGTVQTVTTDDSGLGIFNAGVTVSLPPIGGENACSIIYKAQADDPNNPGGIIFSYGGFIAALDNVLK